MISKVFNDRLLLTRVEPEEVSEKGYILPEETDMSLLGIVAHVGESVTDVTVGEHVIFDEYDHRDMVINGEKFVVLKREALICKVEING